MLFNSVEFIFIFLPITLLLFWQIAKIGYYQIAILWLIIASLFFYGWWNPPYLLLLMFSISFNYYLGSILSGKIAGQDRKKIVLISGIVVNLALIGYFKYTNFFISTINSVINNNWKVPQIILPLAISFFTFQQIAYLVDAYKGETKEYNFQKYSLFVVFFPQLIAGPIVHHKEILPQFNQKKKNMVKLEDIAIGLTIFIIGLAKKMLIADQAAIYATPVFNAAQQGNILTFYEAWSGALFYTFQLYFDFSGYSDMAIGVARMFGIQLPLNFNSPYKAVNISDFWRRWHITLSEFLRDYLYIPLGGNRKGEIRRYINLIVTMLLGGLWHGAGWTFVIWGGLHGLYLCINHQWHYLRKLLGHDLKKSSWYGRSMGVLITFVAVVVAWVLFRAQTLSSAISILSSMFGFHGLSFSSSVVEMKKEMLLVLLLMVWFVPNTQQLMSFYKPDLNLAKTVSGDILPKIKRITSSSIGIIIGLLFFCITKILLEAPKSEFLYFNF